METEIWKDIPGWEGLYSICSIGNQVRSDRKNKGNIMKIHKNCGYLSISLFKLGYKKTYKIHRIKALVFIPNPSNKEYINHIDGNKLNNDLSNLEWCTASENTIHAFKIGLMKNNTFIVNHPSKGKFGKDSINSKSVVQYSLYGNYIKLWESMSDAYRDLGIPISNISHCCKGNRKTAGGFIWKYE